MSSMVGVAAARVRVGKRVDRDIREWTAFGGEDAEVVIALNPPTERAVLAGIDAAIAWSREWEGVEGVVWTTRQWPSAGSQRVPAHLVLGGANAITTFAGPSYVREWRRLDARGHALRETFGIGMPLASAIRTHARTILALETHDFDRLVHVVLWLIEHPASGWRVRQLPIRGVDTKWLGRHRAVVEALHAALTGRESLGLLAAPTLVRVRFLDPKLRPGGLGDVASPIDELAALDIRPGVVFVLENLETVLAMPELEGAVAVHGAGYGVAARLRNIPWMVASSLVYWGDLDSHGFRILHEFRSAFPEATSELMDESTLLEFRDLWVPEPDPARGELPTLTDAEQRTLQRVRAEGNARLEQERIPWVYALRRLQAAVRHD